MIMEPKKEKGKKMVSKKQKAIRNACRKKARIQRAIKLEEELGPAKAQQKINREAYSNYVNQLIVASDLQFEKHNDEINDEENDKPKTYSKKKY